MLMRRYVNATFRLQARHGWSKEAVDGVNEILMAKTGPMTCVAARHQGSYPLTRRYEERSVPTSLSTHLADLYLDELDKVLALPEVNAQVGSPRRVMYGRR
jgi:ribosomal RNA-processing protein 1